MYGRETGSWHYGKSSQNSNTFFSVIVLKILLNFIFLSFSNLFFGVTFLFLNIAKYVCNESCRGKLAPTSPFNQGWNSPQELEVRSLYHLYSLKTKSSRYHYVVMTRSETKLSVAIQTPVSGQSAVNVATATSKCSITFLLPYDQDGDVKTKQDNVANIL